MHAARNILLTIIVVLKFRDSLQSIQATLDAIPNVVKRGQDTSLYCNYDLHGAPLYMVKWYRGKFEFYRFTPKEPQQQKVFLTKGIPFHVDRELSNATQVTLRNLEFSMSGNYSCEVSADSPSFYTIIAHNHVDVVELPRNPPMIETKKQSYGPGDTLQATCESAVSKPAANLIFLINNEVMSLASYKVHAAGDGMEWSSLEMTVPLTKMHFRGGKIIIRCMAHIKPVYAESVSLSFATLVDPKSERIMSSASRFIDCSSFLLLTIAILLLKIVPSWAQFDFDSFSMEYDNFEETNENLINSLN